jgi:hypothetical protein
LNVGSNKNGQAKIGSDDLTFLSSKLNLKDGSGKDFDPTTYTQLRTWLLNSTATNMAYMLSVQLATMELAVYNGLVNGNSLIYAPGMMSANSATPPLGFATVNAVMSEAKSALGSCGTPCDATTANIARRAYFELLKNALDKANNNLTFVQPDPSTCPAKPTTVAQ